MGESLSSARRPFRQGGGFAEAFERLRSFFTDRIWRPSQEQDRGAWKLLFAASRIGYSVVRGFLANRLTLRAAALTYMSVLSLVPFLAFAFAVLKGLGAYTGFIQNTVRPYLSATFGANRSLLSAIDLVFQFVDRTNVSTLGAVGLLALVYTSVNLLSSVEAALNDVLGFQTRRPFVRQLTDYVTLLVTTPLLILVATTFAAAAQSSSAVLFLRDTLQLGPVIDFLLHFTSLVVVGAALFAIYMILPSGRVQPTSALLGAVAAALLWQGVLVLYVRLQIGVTGYSALYSVVSAVPIFLLWCYASWLVLLIGAQVLASHQSGESSPERLSPRVDQVLREELAVVLAALLARDFLAGAGHRDEAALARAIQVPRSTVRQVLDALVHAGLMARASFGQEAGYLPGRDLDSIHVGDLRDAVRRDPRTDALRSQMEHSAGPALREALKATVAAPGIAAQDFTLRELAARAEPGPPDASS